VSDVNTAVQRKCRHLKFCFDVQRTGKDRSVIEKTLGVADGLIVSLDYTLRLEDDEVIDSSEGRSPLEYMQGQNQIVPGLEKALYGMAVGEKKHVVVEPAEGYGERNPDANQVIPRDAFQRDAELEVGMPVQVSDGSGRRATAFVADVSPETVKLDFNHPLAGETLYFQVEIAGLREPTAADLMGGCGSCGGCSTSSAGCG
jgi:FKBP-type peptidyl-prolyl cis-trans isomerase SlyD